MIDLETGVIEFNGMIITPNFKLEDFKKYSSKKININEFSFGWCATIIEPIYSNDIKAQIKIYKTNLYRYLEINFYNTDYEHWLNACTLWLQGMLIDNFETSKGRININTSWGSICTINTVDRDYGSMWKLTITYKENK